MQGQKWLQFTLRQPTFMSFAMVAGALQLQLQRQLP